MFLENGENWAYDYSKYFGETCIELNYTTSEITKRIPFNYSSQDLIKKYCDMPSFFEFKKWNNGCSLSLSETSKSEAKE
ncbi:unnamed protein product [marine sediment metagenome]|uniref:Uncharacterized protein n=1 Tax=marine sediment metagenome TaxID=412755 RepID=X1CK00_9ZZZZ